MGEEEREGEAVAVLWLGLRVSARRRIGEIQRALLRNVATVSRVAKKVW